MSERLCARCGEREAKNGQRWCNKCRRGHKKPPANVDANKGRTPEHRYVPFLAGRPASDESWFDDYLAHLSHNGGPQLAAYAAGIHPTAADAMYKANEDFAREVDIAAAYYVALIDWESVNVGRTKSNPLPYFFKLKSERPERYQDRVVQAQVINNTVNFNGAPAALGADPPAMLRAMLEEATPATKALLARRSEERSDDAIDAELVEGAADAARSEEP